MGKGCLCIKELADHLGVSRKTVYRWIEDGSIPRKLMHREMNGRIYFIQAEIDIYRNEIDRLLHEETL